MRRLRRALPGLVVGGLVLATWACGGSNDSGEGDGSTDAPTTEGGADDAGPEGSVEDAPHDSGRDAHHDVDTSDVSSDVPDTAVETGPDAHDSGPPDVALDVHDGGPPDVAPDVHDGGTDVGPPDTGPDVPPLDAPPFDAGVPVTIATHEAPTTLAADDTYVYWENSGETVLDCPVAGCPGNVPSILAFDGSGFGLESLAVGATTAFFLDSSDNIDSCVGAGCSLAPTVYDGVTDGGFSEFEEVVADSANTYFTDGNSVYSCPLASTCAAPTTLITVTSAFVETLAVSATQVFFVREGSFVDAIRAVPIGGGTSTTVCESSALGDVEAMVATSEYVYFTTGDDPSSIYQCRVGGGSAEIYATDVAPYGLATDGTYLYWTNNADPGNVVACGAGASCITPFDIATGQDFPEAIAINSTSVFWATTSGIYSASR